jgi:hypothetical protein
MSFNASGPTYPDTWNRLGDLEAAALCSRRTFAAFLFGYEFTREQNRFAMESGATPNQIHDNVLAVLPLRRSFDRPGLLRGAEMKAATLRLSGLFRAWVGQNGVADYTYRRMNPDSDLKVILRPWLQVPDTALIRIGTVQRGIAALKAKEDWGFSLSPNYYGFA